MELTLLGLIPAWLIRGGGPMNIFSSSFLFLVSLAGSAWAVAPVGAPGPEITSGILGMTMAAGLVYLINRRKRG